MAGSETTKSAQPRTLMQAHDALVRIRPKSNASLEQWHAYYKRSVALYLEIAEIDRGHHHEALYWAERELEKAKEVMVRIRAEKPRNNPIPMRGGDSHGVGPGLGSAG